MVQYVQPDAQVIQDLKDIANKLRIDSIESTNASASGHPTSCSSMAELMSVLFFNTMRYKISEPRAASSDRFILSKGHAAPILYAAWAEAGLFPRENLKNLRKFDSDLEGHPTPRLSFVDVATGSLGQGLGVACGMAYVGKYIDKSSYRTYCLLGDGESAEGSVWEALNFAGHYKLDNLVTIFDVNRLGQSQATSLGHDMETYKKRVEAFGHHAIVVDGHDVEALCQAFHEASATKDRPTVILAKTFKGKAFQGIEDLEGFHGKALGASAEKVLNDLKQMLANPAVSRKPLADSDDAPAVNITGIKLSEAPAYSKGDKVATRLAYGTALVKLARANQRVVALDGDVKNSTFSDKLKKEFPERFVECFIAEQNLISVGIGMGCRGRTVPFVSTFAAFFTRAFDQIRMGAISQTNLNFAGSHAGVSIGEDGPSQMALEDLAMFRTVPGSTVFYPSDAVSAERAVELAANTPGICFIRTSRPNTAVLYSNDEVFQLGKAKIVRQSNADQVLLIGCAVTLEESLKAADILQTTGIAARVLDPFTLKPLDVEAVIQNAQACGGRVVTVEDHYPEGGLGEAVLSALAGVRHVAVKVLAVREIPRSGKPQELIEKYGIGASSIVQAAKDLISQ